jgi:hypothetical protein
VRPGVEIWALCRTKCLLRGADIDVQFKGENGGESATQVGQLQTKQGARGSVTFSVEVYNLGLNKRRLIRATYPDVLKDKVFRQIAEWNEMWAKKAAG